MQITDNRLTVTSWYFTGTRHFELDIPRQILKQWHGLFIEACSVARSDRQFPAQSHLRTRPLQ